MIVSHRIRSYELFDTDGARVWLAQFSEQELPVAKRVLAALTLISHSAFERALTRLIERTASEYDGPIALYATRELPPGARILELQTDSNGEMPTAIDAVARGSDLGSEARVAAIIRNLGRAKPQKFLNHPTIPVMREKKCRAIFIIDDLLGSGKRTSLFLDSIWLSPTIRSWHSLGLLKLVAIAYSSTTVGETTVKNAAYRPTVVIQRHCPTFWNIPWKPSDRNEVISLCRRWGKKTSRPGMKLGFKKTMVALVFEHGCPNNAPAILWAPANKEASWQPLFPDKSVLAGEASAFPPEIARRNPEKVAEDIGNMRLAASGAFTTKGPIGFAVLMVLALVAKGMRSRAAIGYATSMSAQECGDTLDQCVARGFLSPTLRLTDAGRRELSYASSIDQLSKTLPERGDDAYYPRQLRGLRNG